MLPSTLIHRYDLYFTNFIKQTNLRHLKSKTDAKAKEHNNPHQRKQGPRNGQVISRAGSYILIAKNLRKRNIYQEQDIINRGGYCRKMSILVWQVNSIGITMYLGVLVYEKKKKKRQKTC